MGVLARARDIDPEAFLELDDNPPRQRAADERDSLEDLATFERCVDGFADRLAARAVGADPDE